MGINAKLFSFTFYDSMYWMGVNSTINYPLLHLSLDGEYGEALTQNAFNLKNETEFLQCEM